MMIGLVHPHKRIAVTCMHNKIIISISSGGTLLLLEKYSMVFDAVLSFLGGLKRKCA